MCVLINWIIYLVNVISDFIGQEIVGTFYEKELQKKSKII